MNLPCQFETKDKYLHIVSSGSSSSSSDMFPKESSMRFFLLLLGLIQVSLIFAHEGHHHHHNHVRRGQEENEEGVIKRCGTPDPTPEELERVDSELQEFLTEWPGLTDEAGLTTIPTYWFNIQRSDGTGGTTTSPIQQQMKILNQNFASFGFTFNLVEITNVPNDVYYFADVETVEQTKMKQFLRRGDAATLNIYSNDLLETSGGILGYATFPSDYADNPLDDGVVVGYTTLPGGSTTDFNEGMTLVHEVGHWSVHIS